MSCKLKSLKGPLKIWSKECFENLDLKIKKLESVIHDIDLMEENRSLSAIDLARLFAAHSHLNMWSIRRERIRRQRARSYGFSLKDHNSKFFHASSMFRRKRNEVFHLIINGRRVSGVPELKTEVRNYFVQRFSQDPLLDFDFDLDNHPKLSIE